MDEQRDNQQQGGDINLALIVTCGFVAAMLLIVLVIGIQAWFYHAHEAEFERKVVNTPYTELQSLKERQVGTLNSYRHVDQKQGLVQIPIEVAIKQYVQRRAAQPETQPD